MHRQNVTKFASTALHEYKNYFCQIPKGKWPSNYKNYLFWIFLDVAFLQFDITFFIQSLKISIKNEICLLYIKKIKRILLTYDSAPGFYPKPLTFHQKTCYRNLGYQYQQKKMQMKYFYTLMLFRTICIFWEKLFALFYIGSLW